MIGLGVYRGDEYPTLDGIYFSGDLCTGKIRGLQRDENGVWQFQDLLDTATRITGAGQDESGTLYVTALNSGRGGELEARDGSLWKLVSADKVPEGAVTVPLGSPKGGDEAAPNGDDADAAPADQIGEQPADTATPAVDTDTGADATANNKLTVTMNDMFFDPDRIEIPADTDVKVTLENNGDTLHNFTVADTDISVDVEPGTTGEAVINLPAGKYKVFCNVPGHKEAGMTAQLIIK